MKQLILGALIALLFASCGTSPKSGINVLGRWYVYTDETMQEVDSTAFFELTLQAQSALMTIPIIHNLFL